MQSQPWSDLISPNSPPHCGQTAISVRWLFFSNWHSKTRVILHSGQYTQLKSYSMFYSFINPLYPPILGDFKIWGTPPDPWQRGSAPLHSLFTKFPCWALRPALSELRWGQAFPRYGMTSLSPRPACRKALAYGGKRHLCFCPGPAPCN